MSVDKQGKGTGEGAVERNTSRQMLVEYWIRNDASFPQSILIFQFFVSRVASNGLCRNKSCKI